MKTTFFPTEKAAEAAGYASFNAVPHLAIEVPDGNSTLTVRTSEGKLVTFAFLSYTTGGPPQCVDLFNHSAPEVEITHHYKPKEKQMLRPQSIVAFAPWGCGNPYRSKPLEIADHRTVVVLTTLVLQNPTPAKV